MAPEWLRIFYTLVALIMLGGVAVTNLVWPRKVQAFAMWMLKDRRPHPLFGPRTPEIVYANIIICGIGSIIPTIILIRVLIELIYQVWKSN
jgi:hypothetical protein